MEVGGEVRGRGAGGGGVGSGSGIQAKAVTDNRRTRAGSNKGFMIGGRGLAAVLGLGVDEHVDGRLA